MVFPTVSASAHPISESFAFGPLGSKTAGFQCGRFRLPLHRPLVMGILNITPDSFSDGGTHLSVHAACKRVEQMIEEGVDIIDIGGESTRPGATPISAEEELARVLPVIETLQGHDLDIPLSIDTYKPQVMRAALEAGVDMVNDIWGLRQIGALEIVASSGCGVCIMHMQGNPQTMQLEPIYQDPVREIRGFLEDRLFALEAAGIERSRICIDPGFGFGKKEQHNEMVLAHLQDLVTLGFPVLVGLSRKSFLGVTKNQDPSERLAASVTAALYALQKGARIFRVHDVGATVQALKVASKIEAAHIPHVLK